MIAAPADADAVAAALRDAARDGTAVVARGGGTLAGFGNAAGRCDLTLDLRGVQGLHEYDPREMTLGVAAGTTLATLSRELAAAGQFIPFDAPAPERATVGGTLSAGWLGPRRATYGRLRDLLIGSTAALADGTLARAGGMVVKNVTGYDMSKMYVGALGTLGIVVRANFKALPLPPARRLAVAPLADEVRDRALAAVASLSIEPAAALALDGFPEALRHRDAPARLAVLFEGSEAVVERATRELRSALGRVGVAETALFEGAAAERGFSAAIDAYVAVLDDRSITFRALGLPASVSAGVRAAERIGAFRGLAVETIADLRNGDAILRFSADDARTLAAALDELETALRAALERCIVIAGAPAARALIDAWGPPPSSLATMRALKARFDPAGILAPGRYVGGI